MTHSLPEPFAQPSVRAMVHSVADAIASKYPGQPLLTPRQVADVLWNRTDRATVNGIRDRLVAGSLVPGLEKRGGRWEVPATDLIRVYEELADTTRKTRQGKPTLPVASTPAMGTASKRRWRAPIGYREGIIGFGAMGDFFNEVYRIWDERMDDFTGRWLANIRQHPISCMVTATEGWETGFRKSLDLLFNEALATPHERPRLKRKRLDMEREALRDEAKPDYRGVQRALDAAPDDLWMDRWTAAFYLGMSPTSFKKALKRGPHPFGEKVTGATKKEVDDWFASTVTERHKDKVPKPDIVQVSRDLDSGRPYLVDASGAILADGAISCINIEEIPEHVKRGAVIRILPLDKALGMRWMNQGERDAWAGFRQRVLQTQLQELEAAMARASHEDMLASVPEAASPSSPGDRPGL